MPPMRSFSTWVTAIGGIFILLSIMMLIRAVHSLHSAAACLADPAAAHAHLEVVLLSVKYALLGVPFGTSLAIIGVVGRFRRYFRMIEERMQPGQ